jgi:hypothetical protein
MHQGDLTIILSFCFVIMVGITSIIAYAIGSLRKRINLFDSELRQVQFKLKLWDTLLYGDDDIDITTDNKPSPPPVRRGNVVYLTPPTDDE